MDGYSVEEAASVLGVAEGRVWELLARGVLLGTPEGDSMRVFFKGQPGPIAAAGTHDEPRTNGNGGSHGSAGEASAFRELLTEFRNLTERYGQALLALGEARGEVAGLRSRVDQLEARLDLRLPPPLEPAPVAWESATIAAATPDASPAAARRAPRPVPARPKPRPRKVRSPREAVAGFADALARAQDPNAADLGESRDELESAIETPIQAAAEPMTAATFEAVEPAEEEATPMAMSVEDVAMETEGEATQPPAETFVEEAVAVAEEPVAEEAVAVAEEAVAEEPVTEAALEASEERIDTPTQGAAPEETAPEGAAPEAEAPTYSAVVVEPDWFADGDFAWLDAADLEATGEPVTTGSESEPSPAAEPEESADEAPQPAVDLAAEQPLDPPSAEAPTSPEPPTALTPVPQFVPVFEAEAEFEAWGPPEPRDLEPEARDTDPGGSDMPAPGIGVAETTLEETGSSQAAAAEAPEPPTMSSAVALEDFEEEVMWLGTDPAPILRDEPTEQPRAGAAPWPAVDTRAATSDLVRPPLAMTEDELARLALDEGWDESEVAAIRAMITPIPSGSGSVDLPGAAELHEAMAALEAVPVRVDPANPARQWAKPAAEDEQRTPVDEWAFEAEPAPEPPTAASPRPPIDVAATLRRSAADASWLRRRQGPAAAAYRRLRRLFPG